ncbi:MAG: bacterial transcriptional activator domain-containing protein [Catenulisporales bacterium]|nr:bacterial transcriptional activator domain-containing protein [Catenulisporales bacterium]
MADVRISILGPVRLVVAGEAVTLPPLTARLLVRLIAAEGEAVSVPQLRKDVWDAVDRGSHAELRGRNEVQKRVLALRRQFPAPDRLQTEQLIAGPRPTTAYRLVLGPGELDASDFTRLANDGLSTTAAGAERLLAEAVTLWQGRPLVEAGDAEYARPLIRRLSEAYQAVRTELVRVRIVMGRPDLALPLAEQLAAEDPDDHRAAAALEQVRSQLRDRHGDEIVRHELPDLHTAVTIVRGDLFDQDDANLVVGFSDTFDVTTDDDFVISRSSTQGQLAERLFGGSAAVLNRELKRGLRTITPVAVESARDKPRGKRVRYPIGTVVPIPLDGRRVFATAYSRLGNDLVARSTPAELRHSLDRLWEAVARYGMVKPVAVPLVGSGLARLTPLDRGQLLALIVESFLAACGRLSAMTPELRIVLLPAAVDKTDLTEAENLLADPSRPANRPAERHGAR